MYRKISNLITFYHDIEQDIDSKANREECRQILKRLLALEKKYDITATYNIVGKIFQEQPDLIEWILRDGHEIAFHSYNHQSNWNPEFYTNEINLCQKVSTILKGYRSPRSQWNQTTLKSLWENEFLWNAELDKHKEPYFIYKGLVRLPIAADDWPLHANIISVNEWIQQFSDLLKTRHYIAFGSHDFVISFLPEERLNAWEKIIQIAKENKTLIVTFSEAADLYRRSEVSHYYNSISQDWNRETKTLYRTKRFQELIRDEAEKLNHPVIADLASGGGVLSSQLKNLAKKIYCVDNTPGMIADVESDNCIQTYFGDVTDSNLPDNSIDFVICARIIEYLFWPDRLAYEIKRIGKTGATYFVTFPAMQDIPPSNEGNPPNRIRHHFRPDEIKKWTNQIGPGRLIGIQYNENEPKNNEDEHIYRALENNPEPESCPTNWVYIGIIENKYIIKNYKSTIPISSFKFNFSGKKYDSIKNLINKGKRFMKSIDKQFFSNHNS